MQNNIKNEIDKLMATDMDRKSFLKHVGVGFAGILGLSAAVKTLSNMNGTPAQVSSAYGSGAYGGYSAANRQNSSN